MKIRALRAAEVGPFTGAVALEGLSGGLDVLTGPNETGKSTLFAALALLISEKHTSSAREVVALRPDSGGAPLIEADLEIDGRLWRLRKRYLAQRVAELRDLESGALWRGADAEERMKSLLGVRDSMRDFVWVPQLKSFDLPDLRTDKGVPTLVAELSQLIEQEAADAAGAGLPRRLAAEIDARLGELVTLTHGKPRAGSMLDLAQRRCSEIAKRLDVARVRAEQAAARLARLDGLREEQRQSTSQDAHRLITSRLDGARRAVTVADQAREKLRTATEKVGARQLALNGARTELESFDRRIADLQRARTTASEARTRLDALLQERRKREEQTALLQSVVGSAIAEASEANRLLALAHQQELRSRALLELADIDRRLKDAEAAAAEIDSAEQAIATDPVQPELVDKARRLASRIALLEVQIAKNAPIVTFDREPGAATPILIDGSHLAEGSRLTIDKITRIVIEGIGTFTIEPPAGEGSSYAETRDACRAELSVILGRMSVVDVSEAESRLERRFDFERLLAIARARLVATAPRGLAALVEQRALALARTSGEDAPGLPDLDTLLHRKHESESTLSIKREALARESNALSEASEAIARQEALLASAQQRESEIALELPTADTRENERSRLLETLKTQEEELAEALRERSAWSDAALDGSAYQALVAAAEGAAAELNAYQRDTIAREREISALEGALRRDGEEGVGAEIAGLEQELASAEERVADLELEVRALELLRARMAKLGAIHREQVLRPISERLEPLLDALLPGARLSLDGPLLVTRLERGGRVDTMARLSGGTREQVATLVRIAYAGMMAERGQELPLVLDDALAFSDDERLARMMRVLADSARRHQVILLSCRSRALEPLLDDHAVCRLEISPWSDQGTAALISSKKPDRGTRITSSAAR